MLSAFPIFLVAESFVNVKIIKAMGKCKSLDRCVRKSEVTCTRKHSIRYLDICSKSMKAKKRNNNRTSLSGRITFHIPTPVALTEIECDREAPKHNRSNSDNRKIQDVSRRSNHEIQKTIIPRTVIFP